MAGFITLGVGLLAIGFFAEWQIKNRLKNQKVRVPLMWVAWIFAVLGGNAAAISIAGATGIAGASASVVSVLIIIALVVDISDKRPDWPAFFCAAVLPSFMRVAAGAIGALLHGPVQALDALNGAVGNLFGFGQLVHSSALALTAVGSVFGF